MAFIEPFWGTTKRCDIKNLHEIRFGKKSRNTRNEKGSYKSKDKGHWNPWVNLSSIRESSTYELMGSHSLNVIL